MEPEKEPIPQTAPETLGGLQNAGQGPLRKSVADATGLIESGRLLIRSKPEPTPD